MVSPVPAHLAATSIRRVDLPTPGSPASSTTAPGARPSPSTRSSSSMPVRLRRASSVGTCEMRCAERDGAAAVTFVNFGVPRSATLPHAWHSPQRPTQRAVVQPHSEHWKESCFAMPGSLRRATDTTGSEIPEQPSRPARLRRSLTALPVRPLPWIAVVLPSMPSPRLRSDDHGTPQR